MIDKKKQLEILERITTSATFSGSTINRELLTYLVKAAQEGRVPKEINIATEVLGRDSSFDPSSDPYVRSSMYNLRKKLTQYYEREGDRETIRLIVPKGSYHIEFVKGSSTSLKGTRSHTKNYFVQTAVLILSLLVNLFLLVRPIVLPTPVASHKLWSDFIKKDFPTLLVVGDFLTFSEFDPELNISRSIRDHRINSQKQFGELQRQFPHRQWQLEKDYRSFDWSGVDNFLTIASVFEKSEQHVLVKRASKLQWDDVRNHNIIFQGSQLSLGLLNRFLDMTHFRTNIENAEARSELIFVDDKGDMTSVYGQDGNPTEDGPLEGHVLLTKLPGPSNNSILLIVGSLEMSRTWLVHQLTQADYLKNLDAEFEKRTGERPDYFEVLFKVKGFPRTGVSQEIIYMGKINAHSGVK